MKQYKIYLILVALSVGCATNNTSNFSEFGKQISQLSEETSLVFESVVVFSELNKAEAISEGNFELLETEVLQRTGTFGLTGDSSTMHSALVSLNESVCELATIFRNYSFLLEELTETSDLSIQLNDLLNLYLGDFAPAIAVIVQQGKIEKSSEWTLNLMNSTDSTVHSFSTNIATSLEVTANSLQAIYAQMAERRQREIIIAGYPIDLIDDLIQLNNTTVELLTRLEILHKTWALIPSIHQDLAGSLTDNTTPASLKLMAQQLFELRDSEGIQ